MKKSLAILLAAFLVLIGGGLWAIADIGSTADEVVVEEIIRYGDSAAAEGLSLTVRTNFDDHLFWEIPFRAGESGLRESAYRVSVEKDYGDWTESYSGISLNAQSESPGSRAIEEHGPELTGLGRAYYELYERLAPGAEQGCTVRVKDYIDYYPIEGNITLPGFNMDLYDPLSDWHSENNNYEGYLFINEYFRIPVLEDEICYISLRKDEHGYINGIGGGSSGGYNFWTESVVFPEAVYFTINNRTSEEAEIMDTSLIPGGYGIYRLPYSLENGEYKVDIKALSTVKALDERFRVQWLIPDEAYEHILLIGTLEDELWLYVIDEKTMETEQELMLDKGEIGGVWSYIDGEDYIVFALEGERLALVERDEKGEYILRFIVDNSITGELYDIYRVQDTAWDGERLALSGFKSIQNVNEYYSGDFYYAVFDESGLLCFADCDSSLCLNADEQWNGVRNGYYDTMELAWEFPLS